MISDTRWRETLKILVVGLIPYEAGKTTVAKAVVGELVSRGFSVGVSKPVAGHNLWYQSASIRNTLEHKVLVGEDAVALKRIAGIEDPIEIINPLDIALAPIDPIYYLKNLRGFHEILSSMISSAIMMRISLCLDKSRVETNHFLVKDRFDRLPKTIRVLVSRIASSIKPQPVYIESEVLEELFLRGYIAAETCYNAIKNLYQVLVIESFNDSATPISSIEDISSVIAVSPGKTLIYDGETYSKALKVVLGVDTRLRGSWPSTSEISRLINPVVILDTPHIEDIDEYNRYVEDLVDSILKISEKKTF